MALLLQDYSLVQETEGGQGEIKVLFSNTDSYTLANTNPTPGTAMGYIGPGQLGWVPVGGGGGGINIGDAVGGSTPNEALYVNGSGNLANSGNFLFDDTTNNFSVGDVSNTTSGVKLLLDVSNGTSRIGGLKNASQSSIVFTGGGLNNIAVSGNYTGFGAVVTATISHVNTQRVDVAPGWTGTFPSVGDVVTGNFGGIGTVYQTDGSTYFFIENSTQAFSLTEIVTSGSFTGTIQSLDLPYLTDRIDTSITGGPANTNILVDTMPQGIGDGILVGFSTSTGHMLNDSWSWSYTVAFGSSFASFNNGGDPAIEIGDVDGIFPAISNTLLILRPQENQASLSSKYVNILNTQNGYQTGTFENDILRVTLGDANNSVNKTKFIVDDSNKTIKGITDGVFNIEDISGKKVASFYTQASGFSNVILGDVSAAGNHNLLQLTDANNEILFQGKAGETKFWFQDDSAKKWFEVNLTNNTVGLGDLVGGVNGTKLIVDDGTSFINAQVNGIFQVGFDSWLGFSIENLNHITEIGDVSGSFNKTVLIVDDNVQQIKGQSTGRAQLGDIAGLGNNTYLGISDPNQSIEINAKDHVSIGDVSGFFGGTDLYVDNTNALVTIYSNNGLTVNDNNGHICTIDPNGGTCTSDERLKTNIVDLPINTLDTLTNLRTVTYVWNSGRDQTTAHIGFLAQNVQSLYPQLVGTDVNGYLGVNYAGFTPVLVEAIKELHVKISDIQNFAAAQDKTFLQNLIAWLGDTLNGLTAIHVDKQLCIGATCLDESDLQQFKTWQSEQNNVPVPVVTPDPVTPSDPVVQVPVSPDVQVPDPVLDPITTTNPESAPVSVDVVTTP